MICTKCPHKRALNSKRFSADELPELRAVDTVHAHSSDPRFMGLAKKAELDDAYGLTATYRKRRCSRCQRVVYTVEHEIVG
jgi:hypothetical protein